MSDPTDPTDPTDPERLNARTRKRVPAERLNAWLRLTRQPLAATSFTDHTPELVNGQPQTYAVAPLFRSAAGLVEGPRATRQAIPVAIPDGWTGTSLNEGERAGSAAYDPNSGEITLRGSGADLWNQADAGYFLRRPVTGDFQLTVRMLTRPKGSTHPHTKAGLMIRESLDPGSRDAYLIIHRALAGLCFQWRDDPDGSPILPRRSFPTRSCGCRSCSGSPGGGTRSRLGTRPTRARHSGRRAIR